MFNNVYKYVMPSKPNSICLQLLREKYGHELDTFIDAQTLIFKFEKFVVLRSRYYRTTEQCIMDDEWVNYMVELGLTPFSVDEWPCVEIPYNSPTLEWVNYEYASLNTLPRVKRNSYKSALKLDNGELLPIRAKLFGILEQLAHIQYNTEGHYYPEIYHLQKQHYNLAGLNVPTN